ncbi:ribosomal protein S5 domain 2-like protein [Annulohypoxylon bovei var. microspora]|nr:ribosomal protein S5 domain 2-like protein [Annulohypoxylon bovei var. microspora]
MPLDTSTYNLAHLRIDGRRWNELRQLHAQLRTQASADGSACFELGNTKVMCVVSGPSEEGKRRGASSAAGAGGPGSGAGGGNAADILVSVVVGAFSTVDRKRRARGDKRIQELQSALAKSLAAVLHTHLFPRSTISLSLHILSQDGSLLACLINAATLALIDAGVPMDDFLVGCSAGSTSSHAAGDEQADPLMDLNTQEEQELPFLTVATLGSSDKVVALVCESRVQVSRLEGMMVSAVDGCRIIHEYMKAVVKEKGARMIAEGAVEKGVSMAMDIDV